MTAENEKKLAHVTSVLPNKVKIEVEDITAFKDSVDEALGDLKIGSYLEISDDGGCKLIAIIESYQIELKEQRVVDTQGETTLEAYNAYVIEASPLGTITDGKFTRGGDALTIPPTDVKPASPDDIKVIYEDGCGDEPFLFSKLSQDQSINVPVNGNKFFNKHFAIVGSSGSGKSHTVAKIVQQATAAKSGEFALNNSHIVVFDIHDEYRSAFPEANLLNVDNLILPYWLLSSEELEDLFIDTEANDHNQKNIFKQAVVEGKKKELIQKPDESDDLFTERKNRIHYDSPVFFDIDAVLSFAQSKNDEIIDTGETYASGTKKGQPKTVQGSLYGKLTNFVSRMETKLSDKRFEFLIGAKSKNINLEGALRQLIGYREENKSNVTVIDLSGVPFDVLSITVSLISRILFDYGYFFKKLLNNEQEMETPLCLIYEEAHKYVPKDGSAKYKASRKALERIAKEGRKYGVTMGIISQRPSEISETIFSQCNNFIAMRLTNPMDQNYVKRLLPDTLGNLVDSLPAFQSGEALLLGESLVMPSFVKIDKCEEGRQPSSNDVPYMKIWKDEWKDVDFQTISEEWKS